MAEENKIVRLKDIAEALNTSINTVSHALKDKPDISVEMKNKVKKKAMELGYFPNIVAASLRNGSSKVIAVVFDNLLNPYYMIMADLITTKLLNSKYATFIYRLDKGNFSMDVLFKIFSRKVDGIISFSEPGNEICEFCRRLNMPLVLVGRKNESLNISCVYTDDIKGGYLACETLIKAGCKNVAYLGNPFAIECSRRRKEGFIKYLEENDFDLNYEHYLFLKEDNEIIDKYVDKFIEDEVDGIFCFNDMMALDVIRYLHIRNIKVPEQIKVIGYDNLDENFPLPFNLTSVGSNKNQIIDVTLDLLFKQILENRHIIDAVELGINIVLKETCL